MLEARLQGALSNLHQWLCQRKSHLLAEAMRLQRFLNEAKSTAPLRQFRPNQNQQNQPNLPPQPPSSVAEMKVTNQIDSIIEQADLQLKQIISIPPTQPKSETKIWDIKPKLQSKNLHLPPPEKKPPLPQCKLKLGPNMPVAKYVTPRNKDDVTGKVTQTPVMRGGKAFRSELSTGMRANSQAKPNLHELRQTNSKNFSPASLKDIANAQLTNSNNKIKQSLPPIKYTQQALPPVQSSIQTAPVQPIQSKQIDPHEEAPIEKSPINQTKPESHTKIGSSVQAQPKNVKNGPSKLVSFGLNRSQLIEARQQPATQQIDFAKAFQDLAAANLGYRTKENKCRELFLKHFAAGCASSKPPLQEHQNLIIGVERGFNCQLPFQNFSIVLEQLEGLFQTIESKIKDDLRIDPAEIVRLQHLRSLARPQLKLLQDQLESVSAPDYVRMTFQFNSPPAAPEPQIQPKPINYSTVDEALVTLTNDYLQKASLTKDDLVKIRALVQIGLHNSKYSPLIAQSKSFTEWQSHYCQEETYN